MLIFTYLFIFPFTVLGGIQAFVNVTLTSMLSSLFQKKLLLERLRGYQVSFFPSLMEDRWVLSRTPDRWGWEGRVWEASNQELSGNIKMEKLRHKLTCSMLWSSHKLTSQNSVHNWWLQTLACIRITQRAC